MGHNINEGRMFFVGETPWHGIGTELNEPATAKEAIEASKLDYPVELEPIKTEKGILIPDKRATVRQDTNVPLGIVGTGYRVVQNVDSFSFFDEVVGDGHAIYHTAGALGKGERIWILAKLPDDMVIVKGQDIVEKYLVLTNSHDGKSSLKMYFTPVRVVCQNTLTLSMMNAKDGISIRHTGNIKTKVEEARRVLGIAVDFYKDLELLAKELAHKQMKKQEVDAYFDSLIFTKGKERESTRLQNQKNDLLALFERGKGNDIKAIRHTAWTAYNAVTEYVDHKKTVRGLEADPSKRLKNIWFGSGAELKSRAFSRILEVVKIKA